MTTANVYPASRPMRAEIDALAGATLFEFGVVPRQLDPPPTGQRRVVD